MMNRRFTSILIFSGLLSAAYALYLVKWEVRELKRDNAEIALAIEEQKQAIDMLNTEWAYLNRPERLKELSDKYLQLVPQEASQFTDIALIGMPSGEEEMQAAEGEMPVEPSAITPVSVQVTQ
jgi:hypothetical protein